MGQEKDWNVIRWIVSPPSFPVCVRPVPLNGSEHAPKDPGRHSALPYCSPFPHINIYKHALERQAGVDEVCQDLIPPSELWNEAACYPPSNESRSECGRPTDTCGNAKFFCLNKVCDLLK
jgi:hypothetical protein